MNIYTEVQHIPLIIKNKSMPYKSAAQRKAVWASRNERAAARKAKRKRKRKNR